MATIKEVAELAGVSLTTVSRVLSRDDSLSVTQEVRMRIFRAANRLHYVPPRQRKDAAVKKQLVIGVADWQIIRPDRPNVRLSSLACMLQLMTNEYEVSFVRLTFGKEQAVDGIIAFGLLREEEISFLLSLTQAVVFVNSNQRTYENDQVQVDFARGQEMMVEYLADYKRYASIGYIGGCYECGEVKIGTHRLEGLKKILKSRDMYDEKLFHVGEISRESGYALAKRAAEEGTLAEAILLGSDEVAEGALEAFTELGLRIPKDVAVIIYQDIQTLESKWQTGTCLEMLPDYVWENALEMLIGRVEQKRTQAVTVIVPAHLRIGDTA
ncbi:transcriptional regulator, LacI family [Marvinbryantia formatexigens DSM 14469]|uniref:Transcriptional regulator, LacI family n=1 Tax=Marvinbryantia formatexigens DSM 14469 TaxID=478749 RepID=C6LI68_9FIRM|nr:LacI family DNA-binding transcriptional regulator [Marvinbryantia formatexigens]EET59723.1 transcriptional regulator, LacI family [Marvinbryantia formatexigens DSM 14469]UWO26629.1 LacI family transcriptional regulator [Marvinbryantia formatexigens DSM 14469]SDG46523.1 LacI family transcriptional regulator [Marvinbryantia formatexigens]